MSSNSSFVRYHDLPVLESSHGSRFKGCVICRCNIKHACISAAEKYQEIPIAYAKEIFEQCVTTIDTTKDLHVKLANWACCSGGLSTTFDFQFRQFNNTVSIPVKFGNDNEPHFCQRFNIMIFTFALITLLEEKGYIAGDNFQKSDITDTTLQSEFTFTSV